MAGFKLSALVLLVTVSAGIAAAESKAAASISDEPVLSVRSSPGDLLLQANINIVKKTKTSNFPITIDFPVNLINHVDCSMLKAEG